MEDVDLYSDLPSIHLNDSDNQEADENEASKDAAKLLAELNKLRESQKEFLSKHSKLEENQKELLSKHSKLEVNFSSLLITAKGEIERKDRAIAELRKQLDNLTFRRNQRGGFSRENRTPRTYKQNQLANSQNHPSWNASDNQQNETPYRNPSERQNPRPSDNRADSAEQLESNPLNDLYSGRENVDFTPRSRTPNNVKAKQAVDVESDDEDINKTQYRSTVYGERLRKKLAEEAENNRKLKEEAEDEKRKVEAETEMKKLRGKEIEVGRRTKEEEPQNKIQEEIENRKIFETDLRRRKKVETDLNGSPKEQGFNNDAVVEKNARSAKRKGYSNYDKNTENKNVSFNDKNFDNKIDYSGSAHRDHRRRDYTNNKYNHFNNSEHNNRHNRYKNSQHEKLDYSRSSNSHRSRNRERSKSPSRKRGQSHHHKSRHRGRSSSADRSRDFRNQRAHHKERSVSVDRVVVGFNYNKLHYKERSNSSERNKENNSHSKSRLPCNNRQSNRFDKHKENLARDHGQLKNKHFLPNRSKSHEKDKDYCDSDKKGNQEKSKHQFDYFKVPELKVQTTCKEKLPEKGVKRKIDTANFIENKLNEDSMVKNLEILPGKRRKIVHDTKEEDSGHAEHKKERRSSKSNLIKEKFDKTNKDVKSKSVDNINDVQPDKPAYKNEKIIEESKFINNELNNDLEDGEILETAVPSPQPESTDDAELTNVISTDNDINHLKKYIIETQISPKQDNADQKLNKENLQEISDNIVNKDENIAESNIDKSGTLHSEVTQKDEKIKINNLNYMLPDNYLGNSKKQDQLEEKVSNKNIDELIFSRSKVAQKDEKNKNNILHSIVTNNSVENLELKDQLSVKENVSNQSEVRMNSKKQDTSQVNDDIVRNKPNHNHSYTKEDDALLKKKDEKKECKSISTPNGHQSSHNKSDVPATALGNLLKTVSPCKVLIKKSYKNDTLCLDQQKLRFIKIKNVDAKSESQQAEFEDDCNEVREKAEKVVSEIAEDVETQMKEIDQKEDSSKVNKESVEKPAKAKKFIESQIKSSGLHDTCLEAKEKTAKKIALRDEQQQEKQTELENNCSNEAKVTEVFEIEKKLQEKSSELVEYNKKITNKTVFRIPKKSKAGVIKLQNGCIDKKETNSKTEKELQAKQSELKTKTNAKIEKESQAKATEFQDTCSGKEEKIVEKVTEKLKRPKVKQSNKTEIKNDCTDKIEKVEKGVSKVEEGLETKHAENENNFPRKTEYVFKSYKIPVHLQPTHYVYRKSGNNEKVLIVKKMSKTVKKSQEKRSDLQVKENVVENNLEKEEKSPKIQNTLGSECIKTKEKVAINLDQENIELQSKYFKFENARANEKLSKKESQVNLKNSGLIDDNENANIDSEPLAKRKKLQDNSTVGKGNADKKVNKKTKHKKSKAEQIKSEVDNARTKAEIVQKILAKRSSTESPDASKDTCTYSAKQEVVGQKDCKKEKELQTKRTKLEDDRTDKIGKNALSVSKAKKESRAIQAENKVGKIEAKENSVEKVSAKEKDARASVGKDNLIKPRLKPLVDTEIPRGQLLDIFRNNRPLVKVPVPKDAKNVIVVKRRRRPVQLSDSPPVVIVDETVKKLT